MNLLLISGDYWHPSEVLSRGLSFLTENGHTVDEVSDAKDIVTYDLLKKYDAVIIAKGNHIHAGNQNAWFEEGLALLSPDGYQKYVEEGGSLIALHAGISFTKDDCPAMTDFIGASFIMHPKQCPVNIRITLPEHPITEGVSDFAILRDEHYFIERTETEGIVFAESVSAHGTQPAGIMRTIGKGRMCLLTPGHNMLVYETPGFRKLLLNIIDWTGFKK